jgi:acyl-CoA synthetase (AMP-forming)/AMP-acid ligase II
MRMFAKLGLLDWLDDPSTDRGIHVLDGDEWRFHRYASLAARVHGVSRQLRDAGVRPGDAVALSDSDCLDFASALFGALHAGAVAVPVAPPEVAGPSHLRRVAAASGAAVAVATGAVPDAVPGLRLEPVAGDPLEPAEPGALALLQFTSGSTGTPRCVEITRENLEENVAAIDGWLAMGADESGASWLPFHHDMGLVGMLIASVVRRRTLWQMRPADFLTDPVRWLECLGRHGASVTAAPAFGYAYAARRVRPERLAGMDFSGCTSAIAGAERIDPAALAAFAALLEPHGFRPEALRPAYGLAEATLAVTGHPLGEPPRMVAVARAAVTPGERATLGEPRPVGEAPGAWLASSGRPLPGVEVEVVGDDGEPVPDGALGEIVVRSPSVARGYRGEAPGSGTRFEDGRLFTGDAGFLLDGELYVLGRIAESIAVRGRMVHAEALEHELAERLGISPARCAVVSAQHTPDGGVVAVVEREHGGWVDEAARIVKARLGPEIPVSVRAAAPGAIPRTTSGKPRRRRLWQAIAAGEV